MLGNRPFGVAMWVVYGVLKKGLGCLKSGFLNQRKARSGVIGPFVIGAVGCLSAATIGANYFGVAPVFGVLPD
jgi:hypothetical protein